MFFHITFTTRFVGEKIEDWGPQRAEKKSFA